MNLLSLKRILSACLLTAGLSSCVYINDDLGQNFIPTEQLYDVYIATFPLEEVTLQYADSLSGFSSNRITVGAVRDAESGLTTRASAFTLVPLEDEMDFGENPEIVQFHFTAVRDTLSYRDAADEKIIQNLRVHRLDKALGSTYIYASSGYHMEKDGGVIGESITYNPVIYTGGDSLSFDFTAEYGQWFIDNLVEKFADIEDIDAYNEAFPGIYITADEPVGNGGRINMFDLALATEETYYVSGNYAELKFRATYDGEVRDSSFLFWFGAQDLTYSSSVSQYALNVCGHENYSEATDVATPGGALMAVEGGGGKKPVVSAKEMRDKMHADFEKHGVNPDKVVINKATIVFPFENSLENLSTEDRGRYPVMLSPTVRLKSTIAEDEDSEESEGRMSLYYAGLTDASVSAENQGDVNWSLGEYSPDITHHMQELIKLDTDADFSTRNIWLLILFTETITSSGNSDSSMNEYLQNLAYYSYYNNLYGYGYGNYGYGYNSYYNNYYNYALMASMMSNTGSSTSQETQLDKDRYYSCVLRGPEAELPEGITQADVDNATSDLARYRMKRVPMCTVTYSVPKEPEY